MIEARQLADAFARNTRVIAMECDGLSHEESLLQAPFRANCLNWVLGHIVHSRLVVLEALGVATDADQAFARYERDGEPIMQDGPDALPLATLLAALDRQGAAIVNALNAPSGSDLTPEAAATVFGRYFHETWHAGQTELLRQLAGRDDSVI